MPELIDKHHFEELAKRDPQEICKRTLCSFDPARNCFQLKIWGKQYAVFPASEKIECINQNDLHEFFSLFAIHYLLSAKDIPTANEWISEKDMAGGVTFFRGPHEIPTDLITKKVENSISLCKKIGEKHLGTPLDMADCAFIFHITDRIPVALLFWEGDEDFPAESKLLYDKTLTDHFALDIVFALAVGICNELGK